jgi:hypothetical protein
VTILKTFINISMRRRYTIFIQCPERNVTDFGRMFHKLKYTDITQNTYIRSCTVTGIMAREKCGLLAVPRTVPVTRGALTVHCACPFLVCSQDKCIHTATSYQHLSLLQLRVRSCKNAFFVFPRGIL